MAQDDKGRLKKLYDAVSGKLNIGTYDEFHSAMADGGRRQKFYDKVSQKFNIGTWDKFNGVCDEEFSTTGNNHAQTKVAQPKPAENGGNRAQTKGENSQVKSDAPQNPGATTQENGAKQGSTPYQPAFDMQDLANSPMIIDRRRREALAPFTTAQNDTNHPSQVMFRKERMKNRAYEENPTSQVPFVKQETKTDYTNLGRYIENQKRKETDERIEQAQRSRDVNDWFDTNLKKEFDENYRETQKKALQRRNTSQLNALSPVAFDPSASFDAEAEFEKSMDPKTMADKMIKVGRSKDTWGDLILKRIGLGGNTGGKESGPTQPLTEEQKRAINAYYSKEEAQSAAELQNSMYQEYKRLGAPKSTLEYIASSAFRNSLVGALGDALVTRAAKSSGLRRQLLQQATAEYGEKLTKEGGILNTLKVGAASAAPFILDSAPFGVISGASGALTSGVVRKIVGAGAQRALMSQGFNLTKLGASMLSSGLTFSGYEGLSEAINQSINPEYLSGEKGYNWGAVAERAAGGAKSGVMLGAFGAVAGGLTKGMTGWKGGLTKAGAFAGEVSVLTGMGQIDKALQNGLDVYNVNWSEVGSDWMQNAAMVGILKAQGAVSNLGSRGKRASDASKYDMSMTDIEKRYLKEKYGLDFSTDRSTIKSVARLNSDSNSMMQVGEKGATINSGKTLYEDILSDPNASINLKRKLTYINNGNILAPAPIADYKYKKNTDGTYQYATLDAHGNLIDVEVVDKATLMKRLDDVRTERDDAKIQSNLQTLQTPYAYMKASADNFCKVNNIEDRAKVDEAVVKGLMNETLTDEEQQIFDSILRGAAETSARHSDEILSGAINYVASRTGVDVGQLIGTHKETVGENEVSVRNKMPEDFTPEEKNAVAMLRKTLDDIIKYEVKQRGFEKATEDAVNEGRNTEEDADIIKLIEDATKKEERVSTENNGEGDGESSPEGEGTNGNPEPEEKTYTASLAEAKKDVDDMLSKRVRPAGVHSFISGLDMSDEDKGKLAEYYEAQKKLEGFWDRVQSTVDEAVKAERERIQPFIVTELTEGVPLTEPQMIRVTYNGQRYYAIKQNAGGDIVLMDDEGNKIMVGRDKRGLVTNWRGITEDVYFNGYDTDKAHFPGYTEKVESQIEADIDYIMGRHNAQTVRDLKAGVIYTGKGGKMMLVQDADGGGKVAQVVEAEYDEMGNPVPKMGARPEVKDFDEIWKEQDDFYGSENSQGEGEDANEGENSQEGEGGEGGIKDTVKGDEEGEGEEGGIDKDLKDIEGDGEGADEGENSLVGGTGDDTHEPKKRPVTRREVAEEIIAERKEDLDADKLAEAYQKELDRIVGIEDEETINDELQKFNKKMPYGWSAHYADGKITIEPYVTMDEVVERMKANEEANAKDEEKARKESEDAQRMADAEAEAELREKMEEEAQKKAEEEAKKKAEEDAKKKAEAEAEKKKLLENKNTLGARGRKLLEEGVNDWRDYVLISVGGGMKFSMKANGATKSIVQHLTGRSADIPPFMRGSETEGYLPEKMAEHIWEGMPEGLKSQCTDQDVFGEILDIIGTYKNYNEMLDAAEKNHNKDIEGADEYEQEQRDIWAQERGFAHYEDYDLSMKGRRKQMESLTAPMNKEQLQAVVDDYTKRVNADAQKWERSKTANNLKAWNLDFESLRIAKNKLADIDKYDNAEDWFGNKSGGGETYNYRIENGKKVYTITEKDGKTRLSSFAEFARARKAGIEGVPSREEMKQVDDAYKLGQLKEKYPEVNSAEEAENAAEAIETQMTEGNLDDANVKALNKKAEDLKNMAELMNGQAPTKLSEDDGITYGKASEYSKKGALAQTSEENKGKNGENIQNSLSKDRKDVPLRKAQQWLTDEQRQKSMQDHANDKDMARKEIAFLSDASKAGVKFTYDELMQIPEIREAQKKIDEDKREPLQISKKQVEKLANKLLDAEHGSFTHKEKNAEGKSIEIFDGEVKQEKKAFIVIGRPAGGKSSVFANPLSRDNKARIIDSDVVKPWLEGYDGGDGAGYVQNASAKIADKAFIKAISHGDNIVLPRIGGDSVLRMAYNLKVRGYDVQLFYNDVPAEVSFTRSMARFAETGRFLSLKYLNSIGDKPYKTFSLANQGEEAILKHLAEVEIKENQKKGTNNDKWQIAYNNYEQSRTNETVDANRTEHAGRTGQLGLDGGNGEGLSGRGSENESSRSELQQVSPFSRLVWKNNDVKLGEKTEEVWDSQSGQPLPTADDRKVAKAIKSDNFKSFFGDWENDAKNASKVVGSDGKPLVLAHATPYYGFSVFNTKSNKHGEAVVGSHFGSDEAAQSRLKGMGNRADKTQDGIYHVFLNIRNPWECSDWFDKNDTSIIKDLAKLALENPDNAMVQRYWNYVKNWESWTHDYTLDQLKNGEYTEKMLESYDSDSMGDLYSFVRAMVQAAGYDGIRYKNTTEGGESWVAFNPEQIKSIDNKGDFDSNNPDINMMISDDIVKNAEESDDMNTILGVATVLQAEADLGKENVIAMDEETSRKEYAKVKNPTLMQGWHGSAADFDKTHFMIGPDNEATPKPTAQVFYSNAEKALKGIQQKKATPEQWLNMLKNKGGLKAEEDKWMGLSEWLNDLKKNGQKNVTKEEVERFIAANKIEVQDVFYAEGVDNDEIDYRFREEIESRLQDEFDELVQEHEEMDPDEMYMSYHYNWALEQLCNKYGDEYINRRNGQVVLEEGYTNKELAGLANELGVEVPVHEENPIDETRLMYTTNGLDNKREIALVVPTIESWGADDDVHFGDAGDGRAVAWLRMGDADFTDYIDIDDPQLIKKAEDAKKAFDDYQNSLMKKYGIESNTEDYLIPFIEALNDEESREWNRLGKVYQDADRATWTESKKRVLVIDEVQSKRHQTGRDYGYDSDPVDTNGWTATKIQTFEDGISWYHVKDANGNNVVGLGAKSEEEAIEKAKIEERKSKGAVPDAPFRTTWPELAMKRAIRYAAENGYDKLAWTSGEQQAKRYGLENVLDDVMKDEYDSDDEQSVFLMTFKNETQESITVNNATGEITKGLGEGNKLSDLVGKEVAAKMMEIPAGETQKISGFKVGGEGMKAFYDKMLPNFVNKYVKKWGTKVGVIEPDKVERDAREMWSIDITPEMKKSVMEEGQPEFFVDGNGRVYGWSKGEKVYLTDDGINGNTPVHEYTHIWAKAVKKKAPELWKNIKDLLRETPVWKEVMRDRRYKNIWGKEDEVASEVLSRMSGRKNQERMEEEYKKMREEAGDDIVKTSKVERMIRRMKEAVNKFWQFVGQNLFKMKSFKSADDVVDRTLYDFWSGTDLKTGDVKKGDQPKSAETKTKEDIKNELKGQKTEDLLVTLADKNGNIDYGKAREIGRRVAEGEVAVHSGTGRRLNTSTGELSQTIQAIYRGRAKANSASSGKKGLHDLSLQGVEEEVSTLERSAKELGAWYDEEEISKRLTDGQGVHEQGSEADVYKSADGKNAIKVVYNLDQHGGSAVQYLRDLDAFNAVFPFTKCEIIGFTKLNKGKGDVVCPIVKQEWKNGSTALDWAKTQTDNDYPFAADDYADGSIQEWMEEGKGFEYTEDYSCFENEDYLVEDLHAENVIVDEDGTFDAIDAFVRAKDDGVLSEYTYEDENGNAVNAMVEVADALKEAAKQDFGSAGTSINGNKLPTGFGLVDKVGGWKEGATNLDMGGGKFDNATEMLKGKGVENFVFDPFNRDSEHNKMVAEKAREGVDTVTCNNCLNVINTPGARSNVILQCAKALKPEGTAYFTIYEGNGTGEGKVSKNDCWQENRKTGDYVDEISQHFGDVKLKGKLIIAKDPKVEGKVSVWNYDASGEEGTQFSVDIKAVDKDYIKAVKSGDTETAKNMVEEAAKQAMPDTKIVDEKGNPKVMYHGTQLMEMYFKDGHPYVKWTPKFYQFKNGKGFFTSNREDAESFTGGRKSGLYSCYLDIKHPFVFDCKGQDWDRINGYGNEGAVSTDVIVQDIMRNHPEYDGVILQNVGAENNGSISHPIDDVVPFKAGQIKLADTVTKDDEGNIISLSERFDEDNDDIRFMIEMTDEGNREIWEKGKFNTGKTVLVKDGLGAVTYGSDARKVAKALGREIEGGSITLNGGEVVKIQDKYGDGVVTLEYGDEDAMEYNDVTKQGWDVDYKNKDIAEKAVKEHPEVERLMGEIKSAYTVLLVDGQEESKQDLIDAVQDYSDYMQRLVDGDTERRVSAGAKKVFAKEVEKAQTYIDAIKDDKRVSPQSAFADVKKGKKNTAVVSRAPKKEGKGENSQTNSALAQTNTEKLIDAKDVDLKNEDSIAEFVGHKVDMTDDVKEYPLQKHGIDHVVEALMATGNVNDGNRQEISDGIKNGDEAAIREASVRMANTLVKSISQGDGFLLIPMPDEGGSTANNLRVAKYVADLTGGKALDILAMKDGKIAISDNKAIERAFDERNYDNIMYIGNVVKSFDELKDLYQKAEQGEFLAFATDIKGDTFKIGNNSVTLSLEDSERIQQQRETLPEKPESPFGAWSDNLEKLHIQSAKVKQRFPEWWDNAKHKGDAEDAYKIGNEVIKKELVAMIRGSFPDALVVYPHRSYDVGQNKLANIYAESLRKMGLDVDDSVVMTQRANHTGASKMERLFRRARFSGDIDTSRPYVIVDDHTTSGGTMRDLKDFIESKGGEVVLMTSISASRGSTFLRPKNEDIQKLKDLGVTDEQLRVAGIARSIGDLTSNEVRELIRLAKPEQKRAVRKGRSVSQNSLEGGEGNALQGVSGAVSGGEYSDIQSTRGGDAQMAQVNAQGQGDNSGSNRPAGQEIGYVEGAHELQDIAGGVEPEEEYDIIEMARRFAGARKGSKEQKRLKRTLKYKGEMPKGFIPKSEKVEGNIIEQPGEEKVVKTEKPKKVQGENSQTKGASAEVSTLKPVLDERELLREIVNIGEKVGVDIGWHNTPDQWKELQNAVFEKWTADLHSVLKIKNKKERKEALDKLTAEHRKDIETIHTELVLRIHDIDDQIEKFDAGHKVGANNEPERLQSIGIEKLAELLDKRRQLQKLAYSDMARISENAMNNIDDALDYAKFAEKRNLGIEEVSTFEDSIPYSAVNTYSVNTPEEVEALRKLMPGYAFEVAKKCFNDSTCGGTYIPSIKTAFIFPQKLKNRRDVMCKVVHENAHYAIDMLRIPAKDMKHVLDHVAKNRPWVFAEVDANYNDAEKPEEAVTHLLESLVEDYGLNAVLNCKLQCPDEIVNDIINSIIDFWKNGKAESYKHRRTYSRTDSEKQGVLGESDQVWLSNGKKGGGGTQGGSRGLEESAFKKAVIDALGEGAEEDPDDPEPEMPTLDEGEEIYDESYSDKMQKYRDALKAWKIRNREREEQLVEDALYTGRAKNVRATGVAALDVEALDEAEKFDQMMHGLSVNVKEEGIKQMIREMIFERRRDIETSNWEDAVLVHKIKKATTPEQRKLIPYLLEDPVEAKEYPELADVLKDIRDWFDEEHLLLKQEGLFMRKEHDDYVNNYCTHIWDFERSEPKTVADMKNWIRMNSPYTKERVIATIKEGTEKGLKLKYDDITDIMIDYGHFATEAIANRSLVNDLKHFKIDGSPVLVEDSTKDPDFVRIDNNALDGLKVNKKVEPLLSVIFGELHTSDNPYLQKVGYFYDVAGSVMKKIELSLSFFHAGALTETAVGMLGVPKFAKVLFKNMIWDAAVHHELPSFLDIDATKDAVSHFVSLGATQDYAAKDVNAITAEIRKFFTDRKLYGLREGAVMADWVNRGMDAFLWDWLHDSYKIYSFKKIADEIRQKAKKNEWDDEKLKKALDEAGQLVNDTFGGQHWDVLLWSPSTVKKMRRLFLSPDWTISTMRQFASMFGIGSLYNNDSWWKKTFKNDDVLALRRRYGRIFWLNSLIIFYAFYNMLNSYFRKKDEDEELEKAKEMRQSDPDYKSAYELAYPDGMKWYDYTMYGNTLGQQTHLFIGRDKNGNEMYARWGKQFREIPELIFGRDGFGFPTPLFEKIVGKLNPMINLGSNLLGGKSLAGWENPFMKNKKGWERTWGMVQVILTSFMPFSIPTDDEKEFIWSDLLMPSTKGYSAYKAKNQFETAIRGGDIDLVGKVYEACVKNGLNADDLYETAMQNILSTARKAATEGAIDLNTAVKMYNETTNPQERQTLRNKIKKYLGAQDYKQIERSELIEKARAVIDGETEEKGSTKRYDMITTANDVVEDWKLSKIIAGFKQWEDERDEIRDSEGADAAGVYMQKHKDIFDKLNKVRGVQRKISGLKRGLGKVDAQEEKKIMKEIRRVRKEAFLEDK